MLVPSLLPRRLAVLTIVAWVAPTLCFGVLTWESQQIHRTAKAGDKEVIVAFNFKNTGDASTTIREIRTSCACTVAELAKRTYAPGESGAINVTFTLGDREGPQERSIMVTTDDPSASTVNLTLQVDIQDLLSYSPRALFWQVHDPSEEKAVDIGALGRNRITAIDVKEINPKLAVARIETVTSGEKYRILIRPTRLDQPKAIALTFVATLEDGSRHPFTIYALLR